MKTNRRHFLSTALAGGVGAAALTGTSCTREESVNPNYAKLDAVLDQPVFKKEFFKNSLQPIF